MHAHTFVSMLVSGSPHDDLENVVEHEAPVASLCKPITIDNSDRITIQSLRSNPIILGLGSLEL